MGVKGGCLKVIKDSTTPKPGSRARIAQQCLKVIKDSTTPKLIEMVQYI